MDGSDKLDKRRINIALETGGTRRNAGNAQRLNMERENLSGLPTEQEYLEMVRDLEINKILGSFDEDFEKFVASQEKEIKMAEKLTRMLTPVGFAKWAHVHTPKAPFTEKDGKVKGDPKYMIDVCFSADDPEWKKWAGDLKARIIALPVQTDKHTGSPIPIAKQMPIKRELDIDDQPTGRYYVTFKTGEKFKPPVFDKFGIAIPETILVGNESKVRVSYTPAEYTAFGGGIALYLNAVQVIELVEYRASTADAYGFEVEALPTTEADTSLQPTHAFSGFEDDILF